MNCKCTCGGCDCPQIKINYLPDFDASPLRGFVVVGNGTSFVDAVPNTAGAYPTMPTGWYVKQ